MQLRKWLFPVFFFHMRSLEIVQLSQIILEVRNVEKYLKSKKSLKRILVDAHLA